MKLTLIPLLMIFLNLPSFANESLLRAIESGDEINAIKIVQESRNVDYSLTNWEGNNPLLLSIESKMYFLSREIVRILKGNLEIINQKNNLGESAFLKAVFYDRFLLEDLRSAGADINAQGGRDDNTALHRAVMYCSGMYDWYYPVVQKLLHWNAKLELRDKNGQTPLLLATGPYATPIAISLIQAGADLNVVDEELGFTPLMWSTRFSDVKIRKENAIALIEYGANLDKIGPYGNTALHYAASNGDAEIGELLVDAGANFKIKNENGKTSRGIARKKCWCLVRCNHLVRKGAKRILRAMRRN